MTYKVFMRDGTTTVVVATCPTTAKWEAERAAIAGGINVLEPGAKARMARAVTAASRCKCGIRISKYSRECGPCHKVHMDTLHAEARKTVETGTCPRCGSGLHRNFAIAGWWQCDRFGAGTFRTRQQDPECDFQIFTE